MSRRVWVRCRHCASTFLGWGAESWRACRVCHVRGWLEGPITPPAARLPDTSKAAPIVGSDTRLSPGEAPASEPGERGQGSGVSTGQGV